MSKTTDLTRGIYRRIYGGATTGRRINRVSIGAEFWFWRLHMIADDFGRFPAEAKRCRMTAAPLRDDEDVKASGGPVGVWTSDVRAWLRELERVDLIVIYTADGELYGRIRHFEELQPGNRNGRRIERYPAPREGSQADDGSNRAGTDPGSDGIFWGTSGSLGSLGNPGESKSDSGQKPEPLLEPVNSDLVNPGESGGVGVEKVHSESESESESKSESKSESESEAKEPADNDSNSISTRRDKARTGFEAAVSRLIGVDGMSKHLSGSRQHNADTTAARHWVGEMLLGDFEDSTRRFNQAKTLARKAAGQARPMAYLTGCLQSEGLIPKP